MLPSFSILRLAQLTVQILGLLRFVTGSVFITHPFNGIVCKGGQNCTVTWADDGQAPLLNAIGPCDFALYEGTQDTLVQEIALGLDVSQIRALSFTVDAMTGPNSNSYYIGVIATSAKDPNNSSLPYMSFSGRFTMSGMRGKASSPDPAALSAPAVNPTLTSQSNGVFGTSTLSGPRASSASLSSTSALKTSPPINNSSSTSLLSSTTANSSSTVTPTGAPNPENVSSNSAKRKFGKEVKDAMRGGAMVLGAIVFSGGTLL